MLSLHKLEIFARVVATGSFSAAADQLFMSQPAVSKHIQDLEVTLGTRLFERAGARGVIPTPAGDELFEYTQRILALVAEAENKITRVENIPEGQIAIGVTQDVGSYLIPEWLKAFRSHYPNLTVTLQTGTTSDVVEHVIANRVQLGFVEGEIDDFNDGLLASTRLKTIDMFVAVGNKHAWWERTSVDAADLDQQPYISRQPASRTRIWSDGLFVRAGVKPRIIAEFDSTESIKSSVAAGFGIAIMPAYALQREINLGLIRPIRVHGMKLERELKLVWNKQSRFTPLGNAFLNVLSQRFPIVKTLI